MSLTDQDRIEMAADNCEVLRARLAKYEDAEGQPVVVGSYFQLLDKLNSARRGNPSRPGLADLFGEAADALESQAREIERLTREAKNDAIAYKAIIERQEELRTELAALKAQQPNQWQPSGVEYDRSIHHNPDAKAWADLFVATFPALADKHDLMLGWFANAMMAMHDFLKAQQPSGVVLPDCQWSDGVVRDFVSVALRHVEVKGTLHCQDIRDAISHIERSHCSLNSSPVGAGGIPFAGYDPNFCPGSNPENPQEDDSGVYERAAFEADLSSRCPGIVLSRFSDKAARKPGHYIQVAVQQCWESWQARAALTASAPSHGEQVREECRHEFSDDGEFTVHCSKCDLTINAEPPRHVLDSAAQQAFEAGGTEDGGYVLTGDDLDQIVAQACAEAVIEFAAAPAPGNQQGEGA